MIGAAIWIRGCSLCISFDGPIQLILPFATLAADLQTALGVLQVDFPPDETTINVNILLVNDILVEDDEEFGLQLQNPSQGTVSQADGEARCVIIDTDSKL